MCYYVTVQMCNGSCVHFYQKAGFNSLQTSSHSPSPFFTQHRTLHTDNPQLPPLCLQLGLTNRDGDAGTGKSQRMGAQRRQVFLRFPPAGSLWVLIPNLRPQVLASHPLHSDSFTELLTQPLFLFETLV